MSCKAEFECPAHERDVLKRGYELGAYGQCLHPAGQLEELMSGVSQKGSWHCLIAKPQKQGE